VRVLEKDTSEVEILGAKCVKRKGKQQNAGAMDKIKQKSDSKVQVCCRHRKRANEVR
jgi:hypothetical protein